MFTLVCTNKELVSICLSGTLVLMNHSLCMTSSIDNHASPHDPSITLLTSGGAHTAQTPRQTQVTVCECVDIHWAHTHSSTRDLFICLSVYISVLSCASDVTTRNETSIYWFKQETAGDEGKGQWERREEKRREEKRREEKRREEKRREEKRREEKRREEKSECVRDERWEIWRLWERPLILYKALLLLETSGSNCSPW